jgi:hypothetical protein
LTNFREPYQPQTNASVIHYTQSYQSSDRDQSRIKGLFGNV